MFFPAADRGHQTGVRSHQWLERTRKQPRAGQPTGVKLPKNEYLLVVNEGALRSDTIALCCCWVKKDVHDG